MINEHDITKAMLNTVRGIIRENETMQPQMGAQAQAEEQPTNEIVILKNGEPQQVSAGMRTYWDGADGEKNKFMQSVTNDVTFSNFTITPKTATGGGDVMISGKFDSNDVDFTMYKDQTLGLRISANDTQINGDLMELLRKLNGYYDNWQKEWASKLNTENFK